MGVNALLGPSVFLSFTLAHMPSVSGRCAAFEASAGGYARGEGYGAAVLRQPFNGAVTQIKLSGSAFNQDGRSASLTAPNGPTQKRLLE